MSDMAKRAQEVADHLIGTCRDLHEFASEQEINDKAFCAALDLLCFCCEQCGWWDEACEEAEAGGVCLECSGERDDDE